MTVPAGPYQTGAEVRVKSGGRWQAMDQVLRMQRLLEDHPHLEITHFRHAMWHYTAVHRCLVRRRAAPGSLRG